MMTGTAMGRRRLVAGRAVRDETWAMLRLAAPLAATQLAQIAINTTDVLLLGRLGPRELAAAGLGLAVFHALMLFTIGVMMTTSTLFSQAHGAGRPLEIRRNLQQAWLVLAVVAVPVMLLLTQVGPFLRLIGQDPTLIPDTVRFTRILLWSLPGVLAVILLRSLMTAFGIGRPSLIVTLGGIALNAVLAYGLIFGGLGMPRLGLEGSAWASVLTHTAMALAMLAWCRLDRRFARYARFGRLRLDRTRIAAMLRLGLPVGGTLVMEAGLFSAATLLMGLIGTAEIAAHQVTLQICSTIFMVPLGIGMAATIRIGIASGRGDREGARVAGLVACTLGAAFMGLVGLTFLVGAEWYVGLILDTTDPQAASAVAMAVVLLRVAAVFQLVDGLQVIGNAALRGLGDTRVPMLLAGIGYWVIGFPASALLGLATPLSGPGVWWGLAAALAVVSLLFLRRFDRLTRPLDPAA